ncbi:ATP-binding protein [Actinomadura sp. WMMA1423]|uniref:ATP-binding protein n=1 Tax=Actinomadura sp. WMMA1423 TaxID=2591108 RepID=UPI00143DD5E5|nr:ATP-binding protein [Actinomadura sp. WMMA1423]
MAIEAVDVGEVDISCLADRTVPGMVRTVVGMRLAEWGLEKVADSVLLVVAELVTNAVRVAGEREIRVRCVREARAVLVAVWDSSSERPVTRPVKGPEDFGADARALDDGYDDGTGGWGLPLVQALAAACGVAEGETGKWVWARVAC